MAAAAPGAAGGGAAQMIAAAQTWLAGRSLGRGGCTVGLPICASHEGRQPGLQRTHPRDCCSPRRARRIDHHRLRLLRAHRVRAAAAGVDIPGTSPPSSTSAPASPQRRASRPPARDLAFFGHNPAPAPHPSRRHLPRRLMMLEAPHTGRVRVRPHAAVRLRRRIEKSCDPTAPVPAAPARARRGRRWRPAPPSS